MSVTLTVPGKTARPSNAPVAAEIVNVAEPVYRENASNSEGGEDPAVIKGFSKAKSELRHQARQAGISELVRGLVLALIGAGIFLFHWKRAEAPYRSTVGAASASAPPNPPAPPAPPAPLAPLAPPAAPAAPMM